MIPKIIHYVWVGDQRAPNPKKDRFIRSWLKHNPDYKLMLWSDKDVDLEIPYFKKAFKSKNWANISNLLRLVAVYKHGGVYLDTDVLVLKNFDELLRNKCFFGFQSAHKDQGDWVNNAVFGANKHHWFIKESMNNLLDTFDGTEEANVSSPRLVTKLLENHGLKKYNEKGVRVDDVMIYPPSYFYPYAWNQTYNKDCIKKNTHAIHHWSHRWGKNRAVSKHKVTKPRLVMTLLVRDEADIIENNICFHLNHGVDYIVATDNGSKDGTLEILKKYQKQGVLDLNNEKTHTYEQSKWVSKMAKKAVDSFGATHLLHADADEFWYPTSGDLKTQLPKQNEVYYVPVINYLPELHNTPLTSKKYIVSNPYTHAAEYSRDPSWRLFLHIYHPKVMTASEFVKIEQGNHLVSGDAPQKRIDVQHIFIHHFSIRSYSQFKSKVVNGGKSYLKNPDKSPGLGWHWKDWYDLYKAGLLPEVYKQICIPRSERRILEYKKILKRVGTPKSVTYAKYIYRLKSLRSKI